MKFETIKQAIDYAKDQSSITHRKHKAVKSTAWYFDRLTGKYYLKDCFTVVLI